MFLCRQREQHVILQPDLICLRYLLLCVVIKHNMTISLCPVLRVRSNNPAIEFRQAIDLTWIRFDLYGIRVNNCVRHCEAGFGVKDASRLLRKPDVAIRKPPAVYGNAE
jgi:hypothetical protein